LKHLSTCSTAKSRINCETKREKNVAKICKVLNIDKRRPLRRAPRVARRDFSTFADNLFFNNQLVFEFAEFAATPNHLWPKKSVTCRRRDCWQDQDDCWSAAERSERQIRRKNGAGDGRVFEFVALEWADERKQQSWEPRAANFPSHATLRDVSCPTPEHPHLGQPRRHHHLHRGRQPALLVWLFAWGLCAQILYKANCVSFLLGSWFVWSVVSTPWPALPCYLSSSTICGSSRFGLKFVCPQKRLLTLKAGLPSTLGKCLTLDCPELFINCFIYFAECWVCLKSVNMLTGCKMWSFQRTKAQNPCDRSNLAKWVVVFLHNNMH
jgi:hypothetical protein